MAEAPPTPRIFISYSWTSEDHKKWVLDLAERLVRDGIDVILDRWHLQPGHDKFAFMEQMVTDKTVSKVLVVCDEAYAGKADGRKGGVGTETQIISSKVYNEVSQEKFLPLIRERNDSHEPFIPAYMASRLYIDFSADDRFNESYDDLIRNLHSAPELKRPVLGRPPAHIFNNATSTLVTAGKFQRLRDAVDKGKPNSGVMLRDYLENLGDVIQGFQITSPPEEGIEHDEIVISVIDGMRPYRDEFIDFCVLYANEMDSETAYTDVHDFLERLLRLHSPATSMTSYNEGWFDTHRFSSYEWILSLVSILLRARKFATAARFMDDGYLYQRPDRDVRKTSFGEFNAYPRFLDEYRNKRLGLRLYSLSAKMIVDAATHPKVTFRDLLQADVIMMIRPFILDPKPRAALSSGWFPRLMIYGRPSSPLDVFVRATTLKGAAAIRELFGCQNATQLAERMSAAIQNHWVRRCLSAEEFRDVEPLQLMNWPELQQLLPA